MNYLLVFLFCILNFLSVAQFFDNREGNAYSFQPCYNNQFIKTAKIKSIRGKYTFKKAGEKMVEMPYSHEIKFDSLGRLIFIHETLKLNQEIDTQHYEYSYTNSGQVQYIRYKNSDGYTIKEFRYDSLNRIIEENNFIEAAIGNKVFLSGEKTNYQLQNGQLVKIFFNSYQLPYAYEQDEFDEDGYLLSRTTTFKMTQDKKIIHYNYNEKGYLSRIYTSYSNNENKSEEILFNYDKIGNLIEKNIFKNGIHITEVQFVYSSKTGVYSSIITRDVASNFMRILRFEKCTYY
jgi:hypothetical protein